MISLKNIVIAFPDFTLGPVSIDIKNNSYHLLVGPSGSGKSLLLELIAGFREASTGELILRGTNAQSIPPEKRNCSWVPQGHALFPHLTVYENIAYGLRCRKTNNDVVDSKVNLWAKRLEISHLLQRKAPSLSGGERQRVSLARALATGTDILLLDEPFAALEPGRRHRLCQLVQQLHADYDITVLHVTHHLDELPTEDATITLLIQGKQIATGLGNILFKDNIFITAATEAGILK